jgi:Na+-driven multidrug efflux pump
VESNVSVMRRLRILGSISGVQGIFYVVYAILIVVGVARFGVSGPSEVANTSGVTLEVVIFLIFGLGMLLVSGGWFASKRWARAPFLLAQLLALVVSVPLIGATDPFQKWVAILVTLAAVIGIFLAFTPTVTRYLLRDEAAPESL